MSQAIDSTEMWRQIPPEEKIELLSRAHTSGVTAALVAILCGGTMAVGLKQEWFLWGALIASPLIFQVVAGRSWRALRPRVMLEYLAARSAARRFAFAARGKDLTLKLMFRGYYQEVFESDQIQEELEASISKNREAAVWIALFGDAVVLISERAGGAQAEFAQALSDRLDVQVKNSEAATSDYSAGKEVYLAYHSRMLGHRKIRVTSKYPAAMVVFEKVLSQQLRLAIEAHAASSAADQKALPELSEDEY